MDTAVGFAAQGGAGGVGGTPYLHDTYVAYGSTMNTMVGSPNFTYDTVSSTFKVGFSGSTFLEAANVSYIGDATNLTTYVCVDNLNATVNAVGNRGHAVTPVVYGGIGGKNDMTNLTTVQTYTGGYPADYVVRIDSVGTLADLRMDIGTNYSQWFVGNSISGTDTGATGTIYSIDVANNIFYITITGGDFTGETQINNLTVTATPATVTDTFNGADTFEFSDDGGVSYIQTNIPVPPLGIPYTLNNNVQIQFGKNPAGHNLSDYWTFSFVVAYGKMLGFDGVAHQYYFGDADNVNSGGKFFLWEFSQINLAAYIQNYSRNFLAISTANGLYGIGDLDSYNNSTYLQIDDINNRLYANTKTLNIGANDNIAAGVNARAIIGSEATASTTLQGSMLKATVQYTGTDATTGAFYDNSNTSIVKSSLFKYHAGSNSAVVKTVGNNSGAFFNVSTYSNFSISPVIESKIQMTDTRFKYQGSQSNTTIEVDDAAALIRLAVLPEYSDDASAALAGLTSGNLYKTTDVGTDTTYVKMVP
jgi:hypothetical protein